MHIIFWSLYLLIAAVVMLRFWSARFVSNRRADEVFFVHTSDHWPIALHHYRPRIKKRGLLPVICNHGLGANRFNFDLDDKHSLALTLANQGFDTYIIELRGVGMSRFWQWLYPRKWDILFDDFIEKDIPAAIEFVLKSTGAKKVHWVGHSMGAMVSYAFCQTQTAKKIRSVCAIAGPGDWKQQRKALGPLVSLAFLLKPLPAIHNSFFTRLYTPLLPHIKKDPLRRAIFVRENMSPQVVSLAAVNLVSDNPVSLLMQFVDWLSHNDFFSKDHYSYKANLSKITVPFLFISGQRDFFADYRSVRSVYDAVSSMDKKHIHFSRENGTTDFGHGDIVLGEKAPEQVYPVVVQWIEDHK